MATHFSGCGMYMRPQLQVTTSKEAFEKLLRSSASATWNLPGVQQLRMHVRKLQWHQACPGKAAPDVGDTLRLGSRLCLGHHLWGQVGEHDLAVRMLLGKGERRLAAASCNVEDAELALTACQGRSVLADQRHHHAGALVHVAGILLRARQMICQWCSSMAMYMP